jgi:hypothetical protein
MDLRVWVKEKASLILCLLSMSLYVAALSLPAFIFKDGMLPGWYVLSFGWYGLLTLNVAWFANPVYMYSLSQMLRMRYRRAKWIALAATAISLQSWMADAWWFNEGWGTPILALGNAYFVWTLSLLVLVAAAWLADRRDPPIIPNKKLGLLSSRWKGLN